MLYFVCFSICIYYYLIYIRKFLQRKPRKVTLVVDTFVHELLFTEQFREINLSHALVFATSMLIKFMW